MANLKLTSNITDHYQYIFFKASWEVTNEIVEKAAKGINPEAMIHTGAVLSYAGSWSDTLTTSWNSADPKNLRVISGKDIFRDSVQYQSWYVYWSAHQDIKKPDIILRVVEYSATKVALEMDGHPVTGSVIILETGRQ